MKTGDKRRCQECPRHHPKRGSCRSRPSPDPLSPHRTATIGNPLGRGCTLWVKTFEPTSNPGKTSQHETWYGRAAPASPHLFIRSWYRRWNRPSKYFLRCESLLHRAGHRPPPELIADADAGKQGDINKGHHLGGSTGYEGAAGATAAVGIAGIGREIGAGRHFTVAQTLLQRYRRFYNQSWPYLLNYGGRCYPDAIVG